MESNNTTSEQQKRRRIADWPLEKVARAAGGTLVGQDCAGLCASGVSSDTRALGGGELFVALRGEHFDAHDFLGEAEASGAVAAMVDRTEVDTDLPLIVVEDTLGGLTSLGAAVWEEATVEGMHTIDVTGSNGKTTVKEMLALLWEMHGSVFATPGNLNNHIGVPLVLCDIPRACEHLIVELGANAPGEIAHLIALAAGSERIITSIGVAHMEGFGSIDGIRAAKAEIFQRADAETTAIVPYAEAEHLIGDDFPGRVLTVGFNEGADVRVELVEPRKSGEALRVLTRFDGEEWTISLPIPGSHHALNAGTALATFFARGQGLQQERCNEALSRLVLPHGRWRVVDRGDFRFVDDAYNANPSSVKASFDAFMNTSDPERRRRVAIIGEMLELGGDAARWHREVAAALASYEGLGAFVAVGPFAEQMVRAAEDASAGVAVKGFETAEGAAKWLRASGPALVLLKASRGAKLERVVDLMGATSENLGGHKS